jgi:hypothetical protein
VLVICIWAVFLLQWVQALPALWGVLTSGQLLDAAAAVLLAFPDTPVTQALCLVSILLMQLQPLCYSLGSCLHQSARTDKTQNTSMHVAQQLSCDYTGSQERTQRCVSALTRASTRMYIRTLKWHRLSACCQCQ